jgi:hypothetical protein
MSFAHNGISETVDKIIGNKSALSSENSAQGKKSFFEEL